MKLKHYDYVEWLLYKSKALPIEKLDKMEEHLYNCDLCMEIFLSLIDDQEIEKASKVISDEFTNKVVNKLPKIEVKQIKPKQNKRLFNIQFGYYAAVASVTIVLTFGGVYTNLVDAVPKISASIQTKEEHPNHIANFSNNIVNSTSSFLISIENIDRIKEEK